MTTETIANIKILNSLADQANQSAKINETKEHDHEHGESCAHKDIEYSDYEIALKMYQAEVDKPWVDMQVDIDLLHDIIAAHDEAENAAKAEKYGSAPNLTETQKAEERAQRIILPVLFKKQEDGYDIEMPQWLFDALFHFKEKYGEEMGDFMLEKTLSKIWHKMVPLQPLEFKSSCPSK